MSNTELSYLKKNLAGPILKIVDPHAHSVEEVLKSYFREILVMARAYTRPTVEFEDLVVEGLMGLLDAIKRWDPARAKGNPRGFHNLAIVRIKSNMFEYFLENGTPYSTPHYMARALLLLDRIRRAIEDAGYPGDQREALKTFEVADLSGEKGDKVIALKNKMRNLAASSKKTYETMVGEVLQIEESIQGYESRDDNFTDSPEIEIMQKEFLQRVLESLAPDARKVLLGRLADKTLEEVGQEMGFTRERARQIEDGTLSFLKKTRMYKEANPD